MTRRPTEAAVLAAAGGDPDGLALLVVAVLRRAHRDARCRGVDPCELRRFWRSRWAAALLAGLDLDPPTVLRRRGGQAG
jgi:hypothetical protein